MTILTPQLNPLFADKSNDEIRDAYVEHRKAREEGYRTLDAAYESGDHDRQVAAENYLDENDKLDLLLEEELHARGLNIPA